ncbi:nitrilase family protein [Burkholderia sp. R-70006]|nr:nitrilase family protein [Burkholderia sp. R-70006]
MRALDIRKSRSRGLFAFLETNLQISQSTREAASAQGTLVASVQMELRIGEKAENVAHSIRLIEEAAAAGAMLVVLPELANTGYVFESREEALELAEPVPEGETSCAWIDAARSLGIYVAAGIAEREGSRLYNSALLVGPDGYIGTYRKLHLWNEENRIFERGNLGLPVFETSIGKLAIAICYDGWFPEVYRLQSAKGADIICVPTNWVPMPGQPEQSAAMANILTVAAAHSNGVSIVCANRIGVERTQPFIGQSLIVGAQGWPLAGPASPDQEEILYARINVEQSRKSRRLNAFNEVLSDRRDDVYDLMLGTGWPVPLR